MSTRHGSENKPKSERSRSVTMTLTSPIVKNGSSSSSSSSLLSSPWRSWSAQPASDQPSRASGTSTALRRSTRFWMMAVAGASSPSVTSTHS
jgi:hypothetical protein